MIKLYQISTLFHSLTWPIAVALAMVCSTANVLAQNTLPGIKGTPLMQGISHAAAGTVTLNGNTFKPNHNIAEPVGVFTVGDRSQKNVELVPYRAVDDSLKKVNSSVIIHNNERFKIRDNKLYLVPNKDLAEEENATYVIRVNVVGGNPKQDNYITVYKATGIPNSSIKITNAFSPNGDGRNDTWKIPDLKYYAVVQVEVYDRAGNRLYFSKDAQEGWDGKNKSGQVVPGAYFYVVHLVDTKEILRGVVTVHKK